MFRFVQQTQVLKARVPNQLVSASRNSLNSSIRFNSAIAIERSTQDMSSPQHNFSNSSQQVQNAVSKVRSLRRNIKFGNNEKFHPSPESPWYNKVCAFDDCVNHSLESSTSRHPDGTYMGQTPLFWDSIGKAMGLYRDLISTPELKPIRVSKLLNLLHMGLKVNRNQLTSMNKKPDYDSQSFHKEMTNYLCESLREISQDILARRIQVNDHGAMHLLGSFKELLLYEETVDIWKSAINSQNEMVVRSFMRPSVVGIVLPLLYDSGMSYEEIVSLYDRSADGTQKSFLDPNLTLGMIRTSLAAGQTEKALELFQKICEKNTAGISRACLTGTHLAFIGECQDLFVAKTFFERALTNEIPYKMNLQVSSVKQLLQNIWDQTHDFDEVFRIWEKASNYYGKNVSHGISSSLNSKFFSLFFENYLKDKVSGLNHLQKLISIYNNIKPIDEPFFNIILTKCTVWKDREIIEAIEKSYDLYQIPKTIVTFRILLKAMGSISVSNEDIMQRWLQLVTKADSIGQSYIANADWAALRDATVAYVQEMKDNKIYDNYNPALEAANASGAFDDFNLKNQKQDNSLRNDRIELYYKIVKRYGSYCRDSKQYSRITSGIASNFDVAQPYLIKIQDMDVSDIVLIPLKNSH